MKKFFTLLMCSIAALAMTSCRGGGKTITEKDLAKLDDTVEKCWVINYTLAGVTTPVEYDWCTEYEIGEVVLYTQKIMPLGTVSYKAASAKDEYSCESLNDTIDD